MSPFLDVFNAKVSFQGVALWLNESMVGAAKAKGKGKEETKVNLQSTSYHVQMWCPIQLWASPFGAWHWPLLWPYG
jgi:hypothetical protein